MQLPQATTLRRHRSLPARHTLGRHLLILGILAGCAGDHALWRHAQEKKARAAEQALEARVDYEMRLEIELQGYLVGSPLRDSLLALAESSELQP